VGLQDISASNINEAIAEFDQLGREEFLSKYQFGSARSCYLTKDGRSYDSKAIVGAAHAFAMPDLGVLAAADFSGGHATVQVLLERLGFEVVADTMEASQGVGGLGSSKRPNAVFGSVTGVSTGTEFPSRRTLYDSGVHRALQSGIVGGQTTGAESIVVSGGYGDDEDFGTEIIYTGQGGNDPSSGEQVADQVFELGNRALAVNADEGISVRVIRGAGGDPAFSPTSGYRYDGLFSVDSYWRALSPSGYQICRYRLIAQSSYPIAAPPGPLPDGTLSPARIETTTQRIVRNSAVSSAVKALHHHRCQVCDIVVRTPSGPYAEGAHIRPLGRPHDGPDSPGNILCLCPTDHVRFDRGSIWIDERLIVQDRISRTVLGPLRTANKHEINMTEIAYHRNLWSAL